MNTEIELKFLVSTALIGRLPSLLADYEIRLHDQKTLANTYFDTPNLALSKLKAGLRIRAQNDKLEQTLKLAGSQVGGLHQRPEYNVDITASQPDLSLFPVHVWPAGFNLVQMQAELVPLFSTDFVRQCWIIKYQNTELELALDLGEVRAGEVRAGEIKTGEVITGEKSAAALIDPIQELELELVSGEVSGLFSLAEQLLESGGMRLSAVSKAQRGYRLAGLAPASQLQSVDRNAYAELSHLERLGQALAHWQHHEQGVLDGQVNLSENNLSENNLSENNLSENKLGETNSSQNNQAAWLGELRLGISLVEQALSGLHIEAADLRLTAWLNELAWLEAQLHAPQVSNDLFSSARYGLLVLQLTHYLYAQGGH